MLGIIVSVVSDTRYNAELTFVVEGEQSVNPLGALSGIAGQFGFGKKNGPIIAITIKIDTMEIPILAFGLLHNLLSQFLFIFGFWDLMLVQKYQ